MRKEITELTARHAKAASGRLNIKDTIVSGFTLRVSPAGAKTFAMMMRDGTGRNRTYTIGSYPELSVKQARAMAEKIRHGVRYEGICDPRPNGTEEIGPTTLRELLDEAAPMFGKTKRGWRPRGGPGSKSNMRSTIEIVFAPLLDRRVEALTEQDIARCANGYKPLRPLAGKDSANGQVSRAMSYLAPVFDWASHRGKKFRKIGAGRERVLTTPVVRLVQDPSVDDPSITGIRERVLTVQEIVAILPLLTFPAHPRLRRRNLLLAKDYGPIAMKFLFLTLARREEVSTARWRDFDFSNGVWTKSNVKATDGVPRIQSLPLSKAALDLLKSLPGYGGNPSAYVFPNRAGGPLDNWGRTTSAIQTASGTADWTRHDGRRTSSTLLEELGVAVQTIDAILGHKNRFANAALSGSAGHYLIATRILNVTEDPKAAALNKLAEAFEIILAQVAMKAA